MYKYLIQIKIVVFFLLCSFYTNAQDSLRIITEQDTNTQNQAVQISPQESTPEQVIIETPPNSVNQVIDNAITEPKPTATATELKINQAPTNKELEAARKNNPFGLIRNGQPKKSKSISMFPSSSSNKKNVDEEIIEQEIEEEVVIEEVFEPVDTSRSALNIKNPFRLEGDIDDRQKIAKATKIKFNPNAGTGVKNTKEKSTPLFDTSKVDVNANETLKFTLLTILLGLLAYIVATFRSELTEVYQAFLSQNLMALLHRDKGTILRFPYLSMYLLTIVSIGTSIFLILDLLDIKVFESQTNTILVCIAGIAAFFTLKHLILRILSALFPFKKEIGLYSFTIAIFNFIIGISLLPFIALLAFADTALHTYVLYAMLFLVGIILIYRVFRSLIIAQKYLINNKFHFFMYLCTVEIAPMIILFKFLG